MMNVEEAIAIVYHVVDMTFEQRSLVAKLL